MVFQTHSEQETEAAGEALAKQLKNLPEGAVVALYGGLGAGKTAFVRGMARGLGLTERVSSPTFTIVNEYLGGERALFHFDMYRLGGPEELFGVGWDDYLSRGGVIAVEWSENIEAAFEGNEIRVRLTRLGDETREIEIEENTRDIFPPRRDGNMEEESC